MDPSFSFRDPYGEKMTAGYGSSNIPLYGEIKASWLMTEVTRMRWLVFQHRILLYCWWCFRIMGFPRWLTEKSSNQQGCPNSTQTDYPVHTASGRPWNTAWWASYQTSGRRYMGAAAGKQQSSVFLSQRQHLHSAASVPKDNTKDAQAGNQEGKSRTWRLDCQKGVRNMATWTDYKNHVRAENPEIAKDIDEAEAISQIVGRTAPWS